MHILDTLVPPDSIMDTLSSQRLQGIINIGERNPSAIEYIGKQRLIGKVVVRRCSTAQLSYYLIVGAFGRIYYLETSIGYTESEGRRCARGLRNVRSFVLRGVCAIFGDPLVAPTR